MSNEAGFSQFNNIFSYLQLLTACTVSCS